VSVAIAQGAPWSQAVAVTEPGGDYGQLGAPHAFASELREVLAANV
jgi:hypothetical protein